MWTNFSFERNQVSNGIKIDIYKRNLFINRWNYNLHQNQVLTWTHIWLHIITLQEPYRFHFQFRFIRRTRTTWEGNYQTRFARNFEFVDLTPKHPHDRIQKTFFTSEVMTRTHTCGRPLQFIAFFKPNFAFVADSWWHLQFSCWHENRGNNILLSTHQEILMEPNQQVWDSLYKEFCSRIAGKSWSNRELWKWRMDI